MQRLFSLLIPIFVAVACTTVTDGGDDLLPPAQFISYSFLKADNEGNILGTIRTSTKEGIVECCTPLALNPKSLVATFKVEDGSKVYVGDTEQISGESVNDFSTPVTYRIVSPDGQAGKVVVRLSNTGLPVVAINTPNQKAIPPKTEDWLEGVRLKIIAPDYTVEYDEEINIRGRGNTTWNFPKKPYALKLNKKASILGMPEHKRWVLLANWLDKTLLRNHIAFRIAQQTGLEWTPRGEFVEVVINGFHRGNYYLCEQIKVDEKRVNIAELGEGDPSGGYIMEVDTYFDEEFKFYSEVCQFPYMFKDPDEVSEEEFAYMEQYIAGLETVLYDDACLARGEYLNYLDVDSFIDYWFVYELTGNWEPQHPKSVYMHKDRGGVLKAGPVWDFDWETFVPYKTTTFATKEALYYKRLFEDRSFVARVKERWEMFKPRFEGVVQFIDSEASRLAVSGRLNDTMWKITMVVNGDEDLSYSAAVTRLKNTYAQKLRWLDEQIKGM